MRRILMYLNRLLFLSLAISLLFSCDNTDYEELQAEHDKIMEEFKTEYGITEADHIGDGIYLHILTTVNEEDAVYPTGTSSVVVDLLGIDSESNVFDVTDLDEAKNRGVDRSDYVYGPLRISLDDTFTGFYKAFQKVPEGAKAVMLFPHDQAFGAYEPVLYEVTLYRVIPDLDVYVDNDFHTYREKLGMILDDTLPGFDSIYFKPHPFDGDTTAHDINYVDKVKIKLNAYYVETDTAYVDGFPGRSFFPINESSETIIFEYGLISFPVTDLVHIAVSNMRVGEIWDVLAPSQYSFGEAGFHHPLMGTIIVPADMPIHITIELIDYESL